MAIFEDITLTWKGEEKTIKSKSLGKLIAKIEKSEDGMSVFKIAGMLSSGDILAYPTASIYKIALDWAGFKGVDTDEIYLQILKGSYAPQKLIADLSRIIFPAELLGGQKEGDDAEKKPAASSKQKTAR